MTRDPVCNNDLDEREALERGLFCLEGSVTYCFCSVTCMQRFRENPERYQVTTPEVGDADVLGTVRLIPHVSLRIQRHGDF